MSDTLPEIRHNVAARRFETTVDDLLARADYQLAGSVMRLYHTEVPQAHEGRGIAAALVKAALAHARTAELTVEPALHCRVCTPRTVPEKATSPPGPLTVIVPSSALRCQRKLRS